MSMLTLNGKVENFYSKPAAVDKETGEARPAADYVQILAHNILETGERKLEMVTLKVPSIAPYRKLEGQRVSVPVGFFVNSAKNVQFYALRTEPDPIPAA